MQRGALIAALTLGTVPQFTWAAPSRPLRNVKTLYDAGGKGDPYFRSEMRAQVRNAGFRFVRSRGVADATYSASSYWTKNRSFVGIVTIRDLRGRVLWQKQVTRKPNVRVMAFQSIGSALRAAK